MGIAGEHRNHCKNAPADKRYIPDYKGIDELS
jgi:hypothetical protein